MGLWNAPLDLKSADFLVHFGSHFEKYVWSFVYIYSVKIHFDGSRNWSIIKDQDFYKKNWPLFDVHLSFKSKTMDQNFWSILMNLSTISLMFTTIDHNSWSMTLDLSWQNF